jgi:hypothetical protein
VLDRGDVGYAKARFGADVPQTAAELEPLFPKDRPAAPAGS